MTAKTPDRKKTDSNRKEDAREKNSLTHSSKDRKLVLEKRQKPGQEELRAEVDELRAKNEILQSQVQECRQMEKSLKLTQFSMDHASDSIFWLRPDGGFYNVNEAAARQLGYSKEELLQMSVWEIDPDTDLKLYREIWDETRSGGSLTFETRLRAKDGTIYQAEVTGSCIVFDDQEFIVAFIKNVTARKRAEEALRESEVMFRALAESSSAAITIFRDAEHIFVNRATADILGYTIDELLKIDPFETIHPDDRKSAREIVKMLEQGEKARGRLEIRVLRKNGSVCWVDVSAAPISYRGKTAVITIALNVTRRKQAEEAVKFANAYNRSLIEASLDPLVTISPEGIITDVNAATEKVTGYSREELIGTDFSRYFTEPDKAKKGYVMAFEAGSVRDYPLEIRHPDGHITPVIYNASVYRDEEGKIIGVFAAARDITERKRTEDALVNAKAQAELYLDLMSHDITNMNQALMGYLEMMEIMGEIGKFDKELISSSIEIINRSTRMITDLKRLTQLQAGKVPLREMDVCEILSEVKSRYSGMAGRQVTIDYTPGQNCLVRADDLIRDMFEKLVDNAIKHSRGPVSIYLAVDPITIEGHLYYLISVTDTGPGIPDDLKKTIFQSRGKAAKIARRRGFGLYMVRTLVDYYRGRIWVEDRVRGDHTKGARFVVMLPAAK